MIEKDLPALLIGGHAVIAMGHARATFDIDLLIPRSQVDAWRECVTSLSYQIFNESGNFVQFEAARSLPLPAIDLMLVDDEVFESLMEVRKETEFIPTPSAEALVALKLHALRQEGREDRAKDWSDIFAVMEAQGLSLDEPNFRDTVFRHGGEQAVQKIEDHFDR